MDAALLSQLASNGTCGALLVVVGMAYARKDRELKAEMAARIEDAQRFNKLAMDLQKEVIHAVNHLGEIIEFMEEKRWAQRRGPEP